MGWKDAPVVSSWYDAPIVEPPTDRRKALASGATLKFGPFDTGIPLPQGAVETLAGAGQRLMDIGTLGLRDAEATREADAVLDTSPYATAGKVGADILSLLAAGGGASAIARTAGASGVRGAQALQLLDKAGRSLIAPKTVTQAAAGGMGYGAATTGGGLDERLQAGFGGAVGASILPAAVKLGKVGMAAIDPMTEAGKQKIMGRVLRTAAGAQAEDAAQKLAAARELVPGSRPTVAQVAESPGLAAFERGIASAAPGGAYGQRAIEQNAARLNALRQIAGDEGQKTFFEAARDQAAKELYKRAFSEPMQPITSAMKGEVTKLLRRPAIQQAMREARQLALNEGIKLTDKTSVRGLHYAKMALDDQISAAQRAGKGAEVRALIGTRDKLVNLIERLSPTYGEARVTFREMSRPINQMEIGEQFVRALEPAVQNPMLPARVNASSFARAARDADLIAQRATGFPGAKAENILTPEQLATINAVREDLARAAFASDAGRVSGSNTAQNLSMENLARSAGVEGFPNLLSRPVQIMEYLARSIYRRADDEMRQRLAEAMLDPMYASNLLRRALMVDQPNLLELSASRAALPGAAAGLSLLGRD